MIFAHYMTILADVLKTGKAGRQKVPPVKEPQTRTHHSSPKLSDKGSSGLGWYWKRSLKRLREHEITIFAVFGRGKKPKLVSKKSGDETSASVQLAKRGEKLQA